MAKIKITMGELAQPNGLYDTLVVISQFQFKGVPFSFLVDIAENREKAHLKAKIFWELRDKLLKECADRDEDGSPILQEGEGGETGYKVTGENRVKFNAEVADLTSQDAELNLAPLNRKHFEQAEGLTPQMVMTLKPILTKK